jgi:4-amino-4-deoxy-L-arabinose transferase-like glycosyltransferase
VKERAYILLFCGLVCYLTLFYKIGDLPFFGADEPRYARIAEEMMEGGDYVTPHLLGRPWLEKPPLLFWLSAGGFYLFGVSEWAARVPVALLALASSLLVAYVAYRLVGSRAAILGFLILTTSGFHALFSRAASTDSPLAATLSAALACGLMADRRFGVGWSAAAGACLGLAVLAKGPVAVVLFSAIFAIYFWFVNRVGPTKRDFLVGVASFTLVAAPWFLMVWQANGRDFVYTFIINHHLARFATNIHHHSQPFWFYAPILVVGLFPWSFFLYSAMRSMWRERNDLRDDRGGLQLFLWIWALVPFLFFTASTSKLAGYILPVVPPLAFLVGLEWDRFARRELTSYWLMKVQLSLLGAFSLVLAGTLIFGFEFRYNSLATGVQIAIPVVATTLLGRFEFRRRRPIPLFLTLVAGMAMTLALLYWRGSPVVADHHSTREICRVATPYLSEEEPLILYRFFHHSAQYYTGYRTTRDSLGGPVELRAYADRHPQERYLLLTKNGGRLELERIAAARVLAEQGDLFLVVIEEPAESWTAEPEVRGPLPDADSAGSER